MSKRLVKRLSLTSQPGKLRPRQTAVINADLIDETIEWPGHIEGTGQVGIILSPCKYMQA